MATVGFKGLTIRFRKLH